MMEDSAMGQSEAKAGLDCFWKQFPDFFFTTSQRPANETMSRVKTVTIEH